MGLGGGGGRAEMTYSVPIRYGPRDARSNVGFTAGVYYSALLGILLPFPGISSFLWDRFGCRPMAFVYAGTCCPSFWGRWGEEDGRYDEGGRCAERRMRRRKRRVHSP